MYVNIFNHLFQSPSDFYHDFITYCRFPPSQSESKSALSLPWKLKPVHRNQLSLQLPAYKFKQVLIQPCSFYIYLITCSCPKLFVSVVLWKPSQGILWSILPLGSQGILWSILPSCTGVSLSIGSELHRFTVIVKGII